MVRTHINTLPCDVFVNGELVKHVLMFDMARGKCVVARQPVTVVHTRSVGSRILRHTIYGVVKYQPYQ